MKKRKEADNPEKLQVVGGGVVVTEVQNLAPTLEIDKSTEQTSN